MRIRNTVLSKFRHFPQDFRPFDHRIAGPRLTRMRRAAFVIGFFIWFGKNKPMI
jgi:hypothetical protein